MHGEYGTELLEAGERAYRAGRWDEALSAYTRAREQDPACLFALYGACAALIRMGRHGEAREACEEFRHLAPDSLRGWLLSASQAIQAGECTRALALL